MASQAEEEAVTRIAVVDDHPVVREGLVAALDGKGGLEVGGVFSSAEEALAAGSRVDVILLDLEMPGMKGLQAIGRLSETAAVLVLTAYGEEVEEAIRAGAKGYLLKGASLDEIERAIATLAGGGSYIDPRVASRLVAPSPRLSEREREVLRLVAGGQSNKQIATKLRISERTAKFHVTAILNKLGAENRAQAVAIAAEKRLI